MARPIPLVEPVTTAFLLLSMSLPFMYSWVTENSWQECSASAKAGRSKQNEYPSVRKTGPEAESLAGCQPALCPQHQRHRQPKTCGHQQDPRQRHPAQSRTQRSHQLQVAVPQAFAIRTQQKAPVNTEPKQIA